jgi:hypothetical protein
VFLRLRRRYVLSFNPILNSFDSLSRLAGASFGVYGWPEFLGYIDGINYSFYGSLFGLSFLSELSYLI